MLSTNSPTVLLWAVVRAFFGIAQMIGVVVSLMLLVRMGPARETAITLSATMAVTVLSIFLFKILKVQNRT